MQDFLKDLIAKRKAEIEKQEKRFDASEDAKEVKDIADTIKRLKEEVKNAEDMLKTIELEKEGRASEEVKEVEERGGNPMASYNLKQVEEKREDVDVYSSIEYRQAFAKYVRTGDEKDINDVLTRADIVVNGAGNTQPLGKIIPNTIMSEVIKTLKSYGNLYNRVRKLNVQGGVEFPIEELVPTVSWITETTTSTAQAAPKFESSISFGYHICEARISQTLLSQVVTLAVLESEIAKLLAEAFVKEFDKIILSGDGSGKPLGILNDTRVTNVAAQNITMNSTNAPDWTKWREKLFAKIPISYRAGGVLIMTVGTWEGLICTMKDTNNRPLYSETYDVQTDSTTYRFNGKEVLLVENDLGIYDYDVATQGQPYMVYTKLENYGINSNMAIGFKRYFNEDTNKFVNKGLCIIDGKLLDANGTYIIKK